MKADSILFDMLFSRKVANFRTPMSRKLVGGIYIYRKRNITPIRSNCDKVYRRRWYDEDDLTTSEDEDVSDKQIIPTFDSGVQSEEEVHINFPKEEKEEADVKPVDRVIEDEAKDDDDDDDSVIVEEIDIENQIVMSGYYKKGFKIGTWWFNYKNGSALVGELDPKGKLNGQNIAYIYPDRWTALVGHFEDGVMMSAKLARVTKVIRNVPQFYFVPSSVDYKYDISTHDCISNDPLLPDPYEDERVYLNQSKITGAGEGLFAKLDFGPGVVVSFYNGVRLGNDEVDARSWDENGYTMIVNKTEVLDVPQELVDTNKYCATLGHKINHSFQPNCVTELFNHPRFGNTVAVRTNQAVSKGSELTINYGYGLRLNSEEMDVPEWYRRQLELFVNS